MSWILLTLLAASAQACRNALQSQLSGSVSVTGVTLSRFLVALPIALVYLFLVIALGDEHASFALPDAAALKYIFGAAAMQIVATGLMVLLFKQQNYAIGAGLAKSEAVVAALLGALFFGSSLTVVGWVGVVLGGVAVLMLSQFTLRDLRIKTAAIGIACGTAFALTSLWVREASLATGLGFPYGAAWVLLAVIGLQTFGLSFYITCVEKETWQKLWARKTLVAWVGVAGGVGSIGWFGAMSLQHVAYVKTLGQLEVLFMMLIAHYYLKKAVQPKDKVGLLLIAFASVLVILGAGEHIQF